MPPGIIYLLTEVQGISSNPSSNTGSGNDTTMSKDDGEPQLPAASIARTLNVVVPAGNGPSDMKLSAVSIWQSAAPEMLVLYPAIGATSLVALQARYGVLSPCSTPSLITSPPASDVGVAAFGRMRCGCRGFSVAAFPYGQKHSRYVEDQPTAIGSYSEPV